MSLYDPILELDIPKLEDDPKYKAGQQSMQSKIEQLEKEKALQELEINQVSQANQEWQRLNFEKEKRISDALKVLDDAFPTMLDKKAIRILRGES